MRYFAATSMAASVLAVTMADADCRPRVTVVRNVVAVDHIAVAQFVPVAIPSYGVTYGNSDNEALLRAMLEEFKAMRAELAALRSGLPVPAAGKTPHPGALAMARHCAVCHDETTAKGKQPVLFKGGVFLDTDENYKRTVAVLDSKTMPPKVRPRPSAEESFDMLRFIITKEPEAAPESKKMD